MEVKIKVAVQYAASCFRACSTVSPQISLTSFLILLNVHAAVSWVITQHSLWSGLQSFRGTYPANFYTV